jgi:hypothetical protein
LKKIKISIVTVIIFLFINCEDNIKHHGCFVCTDEFKMYKLTILDFDNNPVDSVKITVKNKLTNEDFDVSEHNNPPFIKGTYIIFHDGFLKQVRYAPIFINVVSELDSIKIISEFAFKADDCICHVLKEYGPDSVWIDI